MRPACRPRVAALVFGLALAVPAVGCNGKGGGPLAKAEPSDETLAHVPVPAADGPKLFVIGAAAVYERPSIEARKLGDLQVGAAIARSPEAYGKRDCDGGWYAVRPRGFACVGATATLDPLMIGRGLPPPAETGRALPYRYARARSENVPLYARAPSPADQLANEPDLKKTLAHEDKDALGAAANDVPLDARGIPTGPAVLLPTGDGIVGGRRSAASFFTFPKDAPQPAFAPASETIKAGGLRKGSGLAITGSLELESTTGLRRFAVTTSGALVPTDRLKPALGSTWHGIDLEKIGLPVAFVHKVGVHPFALGKGKAVKSDDELERNTAVPLTGKFRTVEGVRFEETREGQWLRAQDLVVIVKRHKMPDIAKPGRRWMDVSVANQTLTAYEGSKPVYATLVSTGRDQLKDPAASASTPRGTFRVAGRHVVARSVDPREVGGTFDVADVPWVLDVEADGADAPSVKGFSLVGAYWGDVAGEATTFHDVALAPLDAHRLWAWAGPELPEGWQAVYGEDDGAWVYVRP